MLLRLVITFAALLAAGLVPTSSPAAESTSPPGPNPTDIHITSATWRFIAGVEALNATSFIRIPQAQSLLNKHAEDLLNCYTPTNYTNDGFMIVHLYIGATGIPVGVRGDTTGIAPLQARCMLKQAWLYEFSAPPTNEEQASIEYRIFFPTERTFSTPIAEKEQASIEYRIFFPTERTFSTPIAENRPNMIIEYVRATTKNTSQKTSETIPTEELTRQIVEQSEDLRFCQTLALQETPDDRIVTDVEMDLHKTGTEFHPNNIDLTVTNQTSSKPPSDTVTACIRRSITQWKLTLPPTSNDTISTRFFITFQPPQKH